MEETGVVNCSFVQEVVVHGENEDDGLAAAVGCGVAAKLENEDDPARDGDGHQPGYQEEGRRRHLEQMHLLFYDL